MQMLNDNLQAYQENLVYRRLYKGLHQTIKYRYIAMTSHALDWKI